MLVAPLLFCLLSATEQGAWERSVDHTLADLRTIATAIEAYAADHDRYPEAQTFAELKAIIEPEYAGGLTGRDAWGTDFRYIVNRNGSRYRLVSAGADQSFEKDFDAIRCEAIAQQSGSATGTDLIYEAYRFRRLPSGFEKVFTIRDEPRVNLDCPEPR